MDLKEKCEILLEKWKEEIKNYEDNYQFGKCGADDMTMDHGRYDQLIVCADYLEIILKLEQIRKYKTRKWQHEETGRLVDMPVGKNPGYRWYQVEEK